MQPVAPCSHLLRSKPSSQEHPAVSCPGEVLAVFLHICSDSGPGSLGVGEGRESGQLLFLSEGSGSSSKRERSRRGPVGLVVSDMLAGVLQLQGPSQEEVDLLSRSPPLAPLECSCAFVGLVDSKLPGPSRAYRIFRLRHFLFSFSFNLRGMATTCVVRVGTEVGPALSRNGRKKDGAATHFSLQVPRNWHRQQESCATTPSLTGTLPMLILLHGNSVIKPKDPTAPATGPLISSNIHLIQILVQPKDGERLSRCGLAMTFT